MWNFAGAKSLVIVSANTPHAPGQRIDIEILDGSDQGHVYLSKRDIRGETRLAITTHENADVGVCVRNHLESECSLLPCLGRGPRGRVGSGVAEWDGY